MQNAQQPTAISSVQTHMYITITLNTRALPRTCDTVTASARVSDTDTQNNNLLQLDDKLPPTPINMID